MLEDILDLIETMERSIYVNTTTEDEYIAGRIDGFKDVIMLLEDILIENYCY